MGQRFQGRSWRTGPERPPICPFNVAPYCTSDYYLFKMPAENLEDEGLPKNPNLDVAQWRYTLTAPHGINKEEVATKLLNAIKENG